MNILASLPRQERPSLLVIVKEPTRNIRFLRGIEKPPFSYANRTALDGHIVAFSRDIVAGNTPPTIAINNEWWNLEDHPVPSQLTAASEINKIRPEDTDIPQAVTGTETACIMRACITPLVLAQPLFTAPYLSPYMAIACSTLPYKYFNLPLPSYWGNLYGNFAHFFNQKLPKILLTLSP